MVGVKWKMKVDGVKWNKIRISYPPGDLPGVCKASERFPFRNAEGEGGTTDGERLLKPFDLFAPLALTKLLWKTFESGSILAQTYQPCTKNKI